MNKQEYKAWWREVRTEARKIADKEFGKQPNIVSVYVPYFKPFYATTKENMERKVSKQMANALASIHNQPGPYPEESMSDFILIYRRK